MSTDKRTKTRKKSLHDKLCLLNGVFAGVAESLQIDVMSLQKENLQLEREKLQLQICLLKRKLDH